MSERNCRPVKVFADAEFAMVRVPQIIENAPAQATMRHRQ
jgi:hypothetical protein